MSDLSLSTCTTIIARLRPVQWLGVGLLMGLMLIAYLQPWYYPVDGNVQNLAQTLQSPSAQHWLGTDHFGRDMMARLSAATRLSVGMAIMSTGVAMAFGLVAGIMASMGGMMDKLMSFVCEIIMALPGLLLILLFAAIAPDSFWALYLGISLVAWVEFFKISRAVSQNLANSLEIEASRLLGFGFWYCIRRHYLPRLLPLMLPLSAYGAANAILALATLGFINVGLHPPTAELGLMMTELFAHYYQAPYIFVQPVLITALLVLSFQLMSGQVK